jgi:transposase InsO family protein
MYPLRFEKKSHKGSKAFTTMLGIKTSSLVWHFRLRHPSSDVVTRVVQGNKLPLAQFDFNKNVVCGSCQLGKGKKPPFHASTRISTCPLEVIHTDIWTSPVLSMSGYKYYVVFVDDYSRFSWIYPLHTKSETFETFVKFKRLVENTLSTNIKQLQSDGGGEFTSLQFQSFLTNHGIAYRKTCPYTSPQNGVAERKLRHILETGLTLLPHVHISNKYWHDSFPIAVHVINRLPTATLNHMSPFEKLYNQLLNYQRLRVFGCLCYPLLRPYGLHKLEYRSKPCIFLGYQYVGYKCLDPTSSKVYLSRHVVFDETSFPAKDHATSLLSSQLPSTGDVSFPLPLLSSISRTSSLSSTAPSNLPPSDSTAASPLGTPPHTSVQDPFTVPPSPTLTESLPAESFSIPTMQTSHPLHESNSLVALPLNLSVDTPNTSLSSAISLASPVPSHPMLTRSKTGSLHPK